VTTNSKILEDLYNVVFLNYSTNGFNPLTLRTERLIYFVHGDSEEYTYLPLAFHNPKMEVVVFSEVMKGYILSKSKYHPRLIRHVVDTKDCQYSDISSTLKTILVVDSQFYNPVANELLKFCNKYSVALRVCGPDRNMKTRLDIKNQMLDSDLVISQGGRTLYEAMALGRCVVSFGKNKGAGYINSYNIQEHLKRNCSYGTLPSLGEPNCSEELEKELLKYNCVDGLLNREFAISNFSEKNFNFLL
jgi:hypothetical protein